MMTAPGISWIALIFAISLIHAAQAITHPSLAITRPFAPSDVDRLSESFGEWRDFPPCHDESPISVDLFLVYSQRLSESVEAQASIRAVEEMFGQDEDWSRCISRVIGFGVDIDPEADMYRIDQQNANVMWVNGPNRQFERTIRILQSSQYNPHDLMFLMEMDSVPVQPYWLDTMIDEIVKLESEPSPFAILGR